MSLTFPKRVAHYYSWPSGINGSANVVATAASHFANYDVVVFGAGIDDPAHGDNANATAIIADPQMASTEVYGYIDATAPLIDNVVHIMQWNTMGVAGIFCDQFGYDWGVSRVNQNLLYAFIHAFGLKAYVNAWNPADVFASTVDATHNPTGMASWIASGDSYLLESYQIVAGAYQGISDWRTRSDLVAGYKAGSFSGVNMIGLTTYADAMAFDQAKLDYAYNSAVMDELDGFGWGEYNFSSSGSSADSMPLRTLPAVTDASFTGPIVVSGDVVTRPQNIGIKIDTNAHTTGTILD